MLGFDRLATELASLVTSEKNHSPQSVRVFLKDSGGASNRESMYSSDIILISIMDSVQQHVKTFCMPSRYSNPLTTATGSVGVEFWQ